MNLLLFIHKCLQFICKNLVKKYKNFSFQIFNFLLEQALNSGSTTDSGHSWEIDLKELVLEKEIGRGAYGVVFKGSWRAVDGNKID